MSRYRWAWRPGWILSHVFVLACVVAFVNLGFWQLRRLDERRTANALIEQREALPPVPVAEVLPPGASPETVSQAIYRQVTATGTYDAADQVLIRNRTNGGSPGFRVVTPLVLANGDALAIDRGWIPIQYGDGDQADPALYAPPSGAVTVTGVVRETQRQEGLGVSDPPDGRLATLSRIDVPRLGQQMTIPVLPAYVELTAQQPAQPNAAPAPVDPPELDDGPHLSYAGQWFIFATLTVIVYPLLLRRNARNKDREALEAAYAADHPDGDLDPAPPAELVR